MIKRSLFLFLLLVFFYPGLKSQDKLIEKYTFSSWFGVRYIECDSLPDGENLDFLNYLYDLNESDIFPDYGYLGMASHLWLKGNWEMDIKLAMYDDFIPNQFNIATQYYPLKSLGINFGMYSYHQLMNEYNLYHHHADTGFYGDVDPNFRQRKLYDFGIIIGPVISLEGKRMHGTLKINGGLGTFITFSESIIQKKVNSNFRREIGYRTKETPTLFFFPELEAGCDLIRFPHATLGIQVQASYYLANRSLNYTLVTLNWIAENPVEENIKSPKHHYYKIDFDFGIYLRLPADQKD